MATDCLYVVDISKVDGGLTGAALACAYWDARVLVPGIDISSSGVSEHLLDYQACWSGVFEHDDHGQSEPIDTILIHEPDGTVSEPPLGLLELRHLDAMIASVRSHRGQVRVGTADQQLQGLLAIRDACTTNLSLRPAYCIDI